MKMSLISLFVIILCGAIIFIGTTELHPQTRRGMKISVRTNAGEHIKLYNASYALVIGNGNYTNGWDPLPGALQDVKEVAETLKTHDFNVTLKTNLTTDEFNEAFLTFVLEHGADENNRLLFYYAGHGYTLPLANEQERGYLVMVDAPDPDTDKLGFVRESINMETLVGESKAILARHVLFLFDSCFSGTILNARDRVRPESISDNIRHPVRQFITAGRAHEPVPDRSVFKTAFLDIIEGRATEPFRDGYITGEELGLYLKNQVPIYNEAQHPQYGKIRDPKLDKGDFVFVLPQRNTDELPTLATLHITSTPRGATVYLDGAPIGKTPLRSYEIDTGVRREKQVDIGVELAGYKSRVKSVTLTGGQNLPWDVTLEPVLAPMIIGQDGAEMVLIPAGEYQMGSDDSDANDDEKPVHTVYVDAFYMDTYEVTNAQFKVFVDANPQWRKDQILDAYHNGDYLKYWNGDSYPSGSGNDPVVYVTWYAAMAYAQWAGKRLPTEAEWEKAARGGLDGKIYPWGNSAPDGTQCNFADVTLANFNIDWIIWTDDTVNDGHAWTAPVGSYPANGYGLHNMAGNVYEWCLDEWNAAFYRRSPHRNPVAGGWVGTNFAQPQTDTLRVLRGGSWLDRAQFMRVAPRKSAPPSFTFPSFGFRCARDVTPTKLLEKQARTKAAAMPDTSEMVLIPAGDFQMGSDDSDAEDYEKPGHTVYVDAFYIDKYEVTNAQFKAFVDANPQWQKDRIDAKFHNGPYLYEWNGNDYPAGEANHPVTDVSWYAAMAYAQWVGKRLPTEAEWEKAARGGLVGKKYPWGNVAPNGTQCNFADKNLSERWSEDWTETFGRNWSDENADDGYSYIAPIGSYPPNGYGLYDMAGNAAEWCLDGYDAGFYRRSPRRNPLAGEMTLREVMTNYQNVTTNRVMRGGSWLFNARYMRVANRTWFSPTHSFMNLVGFRCARTVTP